MAASAQPPQQPAEHLHSNRRVRRLHQDRREQRYADEHRQDDPDQPQRTPYARQHVCGIRRIRGDTSDTTARPSANGLTYQSPMGRSNSATAVSRSPTSRDAASLSGVVNECTEGAFHRCERFAFELDAPDGGRGTIDGPRANRNATSYAQERQIARQPRLAIVRCDFRAFGHEQPRFCGIP